MIKRNREILARVKIIREAQKGMLAVVLGDSLSMPRYRAGIGFKDTYGYKLNRQGYDVFTLSRGGVSLKMMSGVFNDFIARIEPDSIEIGILGLGIVDCAPRPLPSSARYILSKMPSIILNTIVKLLHKYRSELHKCGITFRITSPDNFTNQYRELLKQMVKNCKRVYVINIAPGTDEIYRQSLGLESSIILYNRIINSIAKDYGLNIIDVYNKALTDKSKYIQSDIHVSKYIHEWIYEEIINCEKQ